MNRKMGKTQNELYRRLNEAHENGKGDFPFVAVGSFGSVDYIKELVNRDMPAKIEKAGECCAYGICPICHGYALIGHDFCPHCGQMLDWEKKQ